VPGEATPADAGSPTAPYGQESGPSSDTASADAGNATTPDLKVGPTGGEREGADPGPRPMAARSDPAGGDSGPSGS
jgi:hypothetical protein